MTAYIAMNSIYVFDRTKSIGEPHQKLWCSQNSDGICWKYHIQKKRCRINMRSDILFDKYYMHACKCVIARVNVSSIDLSERQVKNQYP